MNTHGLHSRTMRKVRGFTLIEVLVALTIVSVALMAALKAAGWGDRIDEVKSHVGENTAWPAALKNGDTRHFGAETIKTYRVEEIARFQYFKQDAVLLRVPAASNRHMGQDWRLDTDFFILIGAPGVAKG